MEEPADKIRRFPRQYVIIVSLSMLTSLFTVTEAWPEALRFELLDNWCPENLATSSSGGHRSQGEPSVDRAADAFSRGWYLVVRT
jgi:hypothetical protein